MAQEDIYGSKAKYEKIVQHPEQLLQIAANQPRAKYYCKNKANIEHLKKLFKKWDAKDLSYVRRLRLIGSLKVICYVTSKDLKDLTRDDADEIVAYVNKTYKSAKAKSDFIKDIKCTWRLLFPETDSKGRIDETACPYVVRHLSSKIDPSKEVRKNDRITFDSFLKLLDYFSRAACMQLYLMLGFESLARPQELCYLKIGDVELYDEYAKIRISSHGKEGTGLLQCIDAYPYLTKWLEQHPFKNEADAYLFLNTNNQQLTPITITKQLALASKNLDIAHITAYSIKRNGVTFRRLRGDTDAEIQHAARWNSNRQLKTYDKTNQEDAFKMALVKKGMLHDESYELAEQKPKKCVFCKTVNAFTENLCIKCKRPLDRHKIASQIREQLGMSQELQALSEFFDPKAIQGLFKTVHKIQKQLKGLKADPS